MDPVWEEKKAVPKKVILQAHGSSAADLILAALDENDAGDVTDQAWKRFGCELVNSLRGEQGEEALTELLHQMEKGAKGDPRLLELALASSSVDVSEVKQYVDAIEKEIKAWQGGPGKELSAMELERGQLYALREYLEDSPQEVVAAVEEPVPADEGTAPYHLMRL